MPGDDGQHRIDDQFGRLAEIVELGGRLAGAQPLERHVRLDDFRLGQAGAEQALRVGRQEGPLDADPLRLPPELAHVVDRLQHGVGARPHRGVDFRHPEAAEVALVGLHRMAEIAGELRVTLRVDEEGQIAADADRVEMIEEEEPVAAEQVLDVVLRRDDEEVDARLVHQLVEKVGVERNPVRHGRPAGL